MFASSLFACATSVHDYENEDSTSGAAIAVSSDLSGCDGQASSVIPSDNVYYITTFGGGADTQPMACGGVADGVSMYAASSQRFGCGSKLQVTANGQCVVLATDDYGPDVCVEAAAGGPILDMSPAAAEILWNMSEVGWSDELQVTAVEVDPSTPTGECSSSTSPPPTQPPPGGSSSCSSATLDRDVDSGVCVQAASDGNWYQCDDGSWVGIDDESGCTEQFAYCDSATLGEDVPARTCVQSAANSKWYQCNGQKWVTPVNTSEQSGPIGACSSWNPL